MNPTKIRYLDFTWNSLAMRCTRVSPACDHCWHLAMANRLAKNPLIAPEVQAAYAGETGPVLIASRLGDPLKRKKPAVIGVQFMGDLFHPSVPEAFVWATIEAAWEASQHTFLILTKRPARMLDVLTRSAWWNNDTPGNVWLGATVENQATADERIPLLLQTPAAVRFVSAEPLLEPVDLDSALADAGYSINGWNGLDLVITGGETGPGARPSHPDWFRGLRDQCQAAGVAFHFKQWGEWAAWGGANFPPELAEKYNGDTAEKKFKGVVLPPYVMYRVGNKRAGNLLDGVTWREMPEVKK